MRTLRFIVNGQIIKPDPNCDFSNLVPGTDGYLQAEFAFSREWDSCPLKVASFWSVMGHEYPPCKLVDGRRCNIPAEALAKRTFKIQVLGKGPEIRLTTNKVSVTQDGGRV